MVLSCTYKPQHMEKILEFVERLKQMNWQLMETLKKLQPADYNHYLPIVQKEISDNSKMIKELLCTLN